MSDLLLRRVFETREGADALDDYEVIGSEGRVIGRIFRAITAPAGTPWMWTLAYGQHKDRTPTHGYEPTREAAMQGLRHELGIGSDRDSSYFRLITLRCRHGNSMTLG